RMTAEVFERELRARFAARSETLANRLHLPPLFTGYLEVLGPTLWRAEEIDRDFAFFSASAVVAAVGYALEIYKTDADVAKAGLWVKIASWRDRGSAFVC